MVKHAARRKAQGLHKLLLEKEAAEQARLEKKKQKNAERMREQAAAKAGSDGNVKALDGVKFTGTFGVNFEAAGKDAEMTLDEVEEPGALMKSTRKKDATKISKQNYLIKKKAKRERKKVKRAEKTGRIIKRMRDD